MSYHILRIAANFTKDGKPVQLLEYPEPYHVDDLKSERARLKEQFNADSIHFVYTDDHEISHSQRQH